MVYYFSTSNVHLEKALAFSSQSVYNLINDLWDKVTLKFRGKLVSLEVNLTYASYSFIWKNHATHLELHRYDFIL